MATTHRSDLTTEIEKALTGEAYDGGMGAMSEDEFPRYVRRLAETAVEVIATVTGAILCDYCGGSLPNEKDRAHIPTVPLLQRMGFAADKIVCPECVDRARPADGGASDG